MASSAADVDDAQANAQFAAVLADAAKQYADSSQKNLAEYMTPPMKSVDDLIQQLELQSKHFSEFRAKRRSICDLVAAVVKPVEVVGELVSDAASYVFAPSQNIYCSILFLIKAADDVTSMYDSIVELFEQLRDFTSRLNVYVQHQMSPALRRKLVQTLASLFQVLVLSTHEVRRGRVKAYFKRLIGGESPVQPALEKLKALSLGEERQVVADTYGGVIAINTKTDRVEELVNEVNRGIHALRLEKSDLDDSLNQDRLGDILEPSPYPRDLYTAFAKYRVEGTGDWIFQDESLQRWLHGETRYLWICGGPGTGKSYLSARLIAWALDNLPNVGYFFFRESYPETKSAVQALKDVAYQLTENDAFYAKQLLKNVSRKEDIKTVSSAFRRLFVEPFKDDPRDKKTYIFLDGIDQADLTDIQRLLSQLAVREDSLTASCPSNIQIALIGRSYMSETVKFALDPNGRGGIYNTSTVTRDRTAGDVSIFISNAIFRSRILSQTTLEFKQEVIETMEKRVDGLFVLAKFMIAEINRKRHPRSILKSLETYPKEINGMLKTTLASLAEKISEEEAADLNEMLQWVACAEAALTLGQLEAALILEFGDPPVRLEEALRGQYASFFELEREDGITTDELMKQNEKPRAKGRDSSVGPSGGISRHRPSYGEQDRPGFRISPQSSPGHRLSNDSEDRPNLRLSRNSSPGLGAKASPDLAQLSSMRQLSPAPATSSAHSSPRLDSIRQASPAGVQTPDLLEAIEEMEFGSSKTSTLVTFFHASVGEFFRNKENEAMVEGSNEVTVGFDIDKGRIHVLDVCLRIFTDPEWFAQMDLGDLRLAMKQYAACHWQEHLSRINPEQASAEDKTNIATQIYKMLTDDGTIFEWTSLFQNQSVSHEIFTDSSIESLLRWFGDSEVQARLDSDAKKWATESPASPSAMVKQIGRLFARAWLSETFDEYLPTLFCFRIVQNVVIMDTGKTWSDGNARWLEASVDEKISTATQWAGLPKTAHWYRRVGSTYLTLGVYSEALSYYQEALGLDTNSVATAGRIAYCLFKHKRYEDGLKRALECAAEEAEMVSRGSLSGFALSSCKWRLYKDNYLAAECYYHVGKIDEALRYFRKAIDSATGAELTPAEYFEPELGYLEVTASENRHEDLMDLLHDLSTQAENAKQGQNRLVGLLLDQCKMPLVLDLIPRAACKSDQAGFLLDSLEMAIDAAFRMRDMVMVLYLRLSMGITWVYFRDTIDAIAVFEQVSLNEYRPRGNLATRQGHALSFQTLASLYKEQVLHVGWDTTEAAEWITKLETIHKLQETHQNADMPVNMLGSDVDLASVFLALFYRLLGRQEEAHELLRRLILESLEILSDDEPQNDEFAVVTLVRAFLAADDINNALSLAQSMCKINPLVSLTTPADSPVKPRAQPKLPDITSSGRSCAQCLNRISLSKSFVTCKFCMEPFCMECVETVIKKPGNETKDHRDEIVCRSDHAWFTVPPMNRILHTGEILLTDGRVQGFLEWKMRLQQQWKPGAKDVPLAVLSDGPDQVTKSDAS